MGTDIHGVLQSRYKGSKHWFTQCEIEDDRNYTLFAILAGVRKGYDFAGVYLHEPLIPISEPRGLPEDFEIEDECHGWRKIWMGDHSYSWLTLDEISDWDGWDKPIQFGDEAIPARECVETFLKWLDYAKSKTFGQEARIVFGFDS